MRKYIYLQLVAVVLFIFTGCSHRVSQLEKPINITNFSSIPVNFEVIRTGRPHIIVDVNEQVKKTLSNYPYLNYDISSEKVLKITFDERQENMGGAMFGALLTGFSLYLIPSKATTDVDITITLGDISTKYTGQMVFSQGIFGDAIVSSEYKKYSDENKENMIGDLLHNAFDKFVQEYNNRLKN
jgi:hypothetical protein